MFRWSYSYQFTTTKTFNLREMSKHSILFPCYFFILSPVLVIYYSCYFSFMIIIGAYEREVESLNTWVVSIGLFHVNETIGYYSEHVKIKISPTNQKSRYIPRNQDAEFGCTWKINLCVNFTFTLGAASTWSTYATLQVMLAWFFLVFAQSNLPQPLFRRALRWPLRWPYPE